MDSFKASILASILTVIIQENSADSPCPGLFFFFLSRETQHPTELTPVLLKSSGILVERFFEERWRISGAAQARPQSENSTPP